MDRNSAARIVDNRRRDPFGIRREPAVEHSGDSRVLAGDARSAEYAVRVPVHRFSVCYQRGRDGDGVVADDGDSPLPSA